MSDEEAPTDEELEEHRRGFWAAIGLYKSVLEETNTNSPTVPAPLLNEERSRNRWKPTP